MCLCFIKRVNPSLVAGTLKSRVEVGPLISVCFFLSSLSTSPNQAGDSLTNLTPAPGVPLLQESKCCINLGCRTAKLVIFNIDQSILESPIILNHWRLIHGINLSFQELNFSGGSQTKRSEVLFANLDHVQSQIVSHGEAWDYSPNLPIVKMNFLVSQRKKVRPAGLDQQT